LELELLVWQPLDEPSRDERVRKFGAVDREIHFREQIRKGTDVVLMRMSDENAPHKLFVLFQVREIGDNDVDAEHLFARKRKAAVDDDDVVAFAYDVAVVADLADTA